MKEIFQALKINIAAFTVNGVKVFNTVALDAGQIQRLRGDKNTQGFIKFPAVLIQFGDIYHTPRQRNTSLADTLIRMKIVTNDLKVDEEKIFDFRDYLNQAVLDGKYTDLALSSVQLSRESQPEMYDNILEWHMYFRAKFQMKSADIYRDYVDANAEETVGINMSGTLVDNFNI